MPKLQKKERTEWVEETRAPAQHTKEFCHFYGIKTWMKKRHFKAMAAAEVEYPTHDMDGSTFDPTYDPTFDPYRDDHVYGNRANR